MGFFFYYTFIFFLYGFVGWIIENLYSYFNKGHVQKDGFLYGPFKPMYAIAMTIIILLYNNISRNTLFLLSICAIVPTTVEYATGIIMREYFNKNYWDYSKIKYNIQGIICIKFSLYWTILTFAGVRLLQPYIINQLYRVLIPFWVVLAPILIITLIFDDIFTLYSFRKKSNF